MARLQIVLKDETERKLRDAIYRANGGWKKGDISNAVEEAVEDWIRKKYSEVRAKGRLVSGTSPSEMVEANGGFKKPEGRKGGEKVE